MNDSSLALEYLVHRIHDHPHSHCLKQIYSLVEVARLARYPLQLLWLLTVRYRIVRTYVVHRHHFRLQSQIAHPPSRLPIDRGCGSSAHLHFRWTLVYLGRSNHCQTLCLADLLTCVALLEKV